MQVCLSELVREREHSLAIEVGRHRQAWLPKETRLCPHCEQGTVETELHFLTQCTKYEDTKLFLKDWQGNRRKDR